MFDSGKSITVFGFLRFLLFYSIARVATDRSTQRVGWQALKTHTARVDNSQKVVAYVGEKFCQVSISVKSIIPCVVDLLHDC